ncbi:LOW QUALITY PROTEIN: glycosylated lysosomal membrane protein [Tachyglossus aculeatus]|uniref:LOW QUALITY PROTEIN: glycosylated lysosomal membrane protein n=1 Tax=Tachyglossus aculeatus TaxID=9261 RepID=UPI0018F76A91|nr:LOW QUALITY PROTEIN: glycosylated lysosomal membrane protein [Tachyglossus aculeatus]
MGGPGEAGCNGGPRRPPPGLLLLLLLLPALALHPGGPHNVTLELSPGWPGPGPPPNVLHVWAVGTQSTVHAVWSSERGVPTGLLVATDRPDSVLHINWTRLLGADPAGSLTLQPAASVRFAAVLLLTKLFEFEEASSSGPSPYPPYPLTNFSWDQLGPTLNASALTATFRGRLAADPAFARGGLALRIQAFAGPGRPRLPPRLRHVAGSCGLQLELDGVVPRGNRSLFRLELLTLSLGPGPPPRLEVLSSIDDEYSPAVFRLVRLLWGSPTGGYLQWRPVAFSSPGAERGDALPARADAPRPATGETPPSLLLRAFFGPGPYPDLAALNLSWGGPDGAAYEDHRYLSWSALLGVGTPPSDDFSPLVLGITATALGAPTLLLLAGGLALLLLLLRRHSEYHPIN